MATTSKTDRLTDADKEYLDAPRFATIATIDPDGSPQLSIVWVTWDGDHVLISTLRGRRKTLNLERDPRLTLLVHDGDNPYSYLAIRGRAEIADDPEGALIDRLAWKYHGTPFRGRKPGDRRVVVRLIPHSVLHYR